MSHKNRVGPTVIEPNYWTAASGRPSLFRSQTAPNSLNRTSLEPPFQFNGEEDLRSSGLKHSETAVSVTVSIYRLTYIYVAKQPQIHSTANRSMENKICGVLSNMAAVFFTFTLILSINFSPSMGSNRGNPVETSTRTDLQTYIVHVEQPDSLLFSQSEDRESWYRSFLPTTTASSSHEPQRMVYSYHNVMCGFAAKLTKDEVKAMEAKDGFVSAREDRVLHLQTTHTPNFLGLHPDMGFWKDSNFGNGVIIGVLDTGVFPTHPSFSDEGMPSPPAKWKGRCEFNVSVCNNKIIGARSFNGGANTVSPIDTEGHGTHTASTAAGAFVKNANALGSAFGTAAGMAPKAHLAIYKVGLGDSCAGSNILAALDAAVDDGVDVLSLSLGDVSTPFHEDPIAIGAFGAMRKGIFVSCSAGNSGPVNANLSNEAPWILTVGASTIDRVLSAKVKLGNGEEFTGESAFQPQDFSSTLVPLVDASTVTSRADSGFCGDGALNGTDVKGKIVLCLRGGKIARIVKGQTVKDAGGVAMILMNDELNGFSTIADTHVLPASHISFADGMKVKAYINSTSTPIATILFKGTVIGASSAPAVASFSSRGPSRASPGILKPDIIGPGVSILAAWPFSLGNTSSALTFNIISGTSMSCPHLSGIAALLKSSHPDWSPAAIKSAIMTTADLFNLEGGPIVDETMRPADLFAIGAGHVNPSRANHPGLVYNIDPDDYIPYLCGLAYTDKQVSLVAHQTVKCSNQTSISEGELNYPSFSVKLGPSQTFSRTLTNVGEAHSAYMVHVVAPRGVEVSVKPDELYFSEVNQKLTYSVTFTAKTKSGSSSALSQGFLKWVSSKYVVGSPILVQFV